MFSQNINIKKVQCFEQKNLKFSNEIKISFGEEIEVDKTISDTIEIALYANKEDVAIYLVLSKLEALHLSNILKLMCDNFTTKNNDKQ